MNLTKTVSFLLLFGVFSGCKAKEEAKYLEVASGSRSLTFGAEASRQTVTVNANVDFAATSSHPEWCKTVVANYPTDNLGISVTRNEAFDGRQATVTLSADGMENVVVTVTQSAATPVLSVVQENVLISGV